MKKKGQKVSKWEDLKAGDFFRGKTLSFFCFKKDEAGKNTALLLQAGIAELPPNIKLEDNDILILDVVPQKYVESAKSYVEHAYGTKSIDNLSYIEALAALKKYA